MSTIAPTTGTAPTAAPAAAPACLYCGSHNLAPLYTGVRDRLGFVPGERTFLRCRGCGSALLDPLPRTEELPGFYPPVYSFTQELGGQSPLKRFLGKAEYHLFFRPQYRAQVRRVVRTCGWRRGDGKKLLDVGCGRGLRLLEFRRLGFDVRGLDVQPDVVRYLRDQLDIPADCADASGMNATYERESFDLITAFQLVEHLPNVAEFIADCSRLLRPGGWLVLANPLFDSMQARVFGRRWICVTEAPRHLSLPTVHGLRAAFRQAALEPGVVVPDSLLNCAGLVGLTIVSAANFTRAYGARTIGPLLARGVGAALASGSLPICLVENYVLGRPPVGLAFARKPTA